MACKPTIKLTQRDSRYKILINIELFNLALDSLNLYQLSMEGGEMGIPTHNSGKVLVVVGGGGGSGEAKKGF